MARNLVRRYSASRNDPKKKPAFSADSSGLSTTREAHFEPVKVLVSSTSATMTIFWYFITFCLAGASAVANNGNTEFGRRALPVVVKSSESVSERTVHLNVRRNSKSLLEAHDFNLDELELSVLDRELAPLYMSMSMSFDDPPKTPSTPSVPSQSPPTSPTSPSSPTNPDSPSNPTSPSANRPTIANVPSSTENPAATQNPASSSPTVFIPSSPVTQFPTFASSLETTTTTATVDPAETAAPTFLNGEFTTSPSATPTPSAPVPSVAPTTVFDLSTETNGVTIVQPPHDNTTVVRLEIMYLVEAFVGTGAFTAEIDWLILETSVVASLGANNSGVLDQVAPFRRRLIAEDGLIAEDDVDEQRHLLSSSSFLRSCNATIDGADCYIMEADIVYILNGDRNAEMSAYLAYLALNNEMGGYPPHLDNVSRVEYLAPQPILPVAAESLEDNPDSILSPDNTNISFSSWTLGAAVACSTAGLMALMVWNRNRRTRNRRHVQLLEDMDEAQPESAMREVVSHPI